MQKGGLLDGVEREMLKWIVVEKNVETVVLHVFSYHLYILVRHEPPMIVIGPMGCTQIWSQFCIVTFFVHVMCKHKTLTNIPT